MTECNPCSTPVDTQAKLSEDAGPPVADPTAYRNLAGALQYLTFTRPDITYAVQQVCLHMHDPREPHLTAVKRLLRYLRGTVDYDLLLHRSSSAELVVYTDADWAGCPDTRQSTSGYAVFLGDNLVSWSSKRRPVVSRSEGRGRVPAVANGVARLRLRRLLAELHGPLTKSTLVYRDNVGAVYLSTNPVRHRRTKHVEIDALRPSVWPRPSEPSRWRKEVGAREVKLRWEGSDEPQAHIDPVCGGGADGMQRVGFNALRKYWA
ncbi:hypothetical protein U9M48_018914 [Paspalum notatum var. saurae]|uniref:Uncharacterized protein n=1 Tax=Paspalum notatum var. saurae TaxID=547442 RepID=A0AAQ3TCK2_PASNO